MTQTLAKSAMVLFATSALVAWAGQSAAATRHHPHHHVVAHKTTRHAARHEPEATTYKVRSGDTLYAIAGKFGVSVEELKKLNHLRGNALHVGQVLKVRAAAASKDESRKGETRSEETRARSEREAHTERAERPETYKVRRGDTLGKIAGRFGVSVAELKRENHLRRNALRAGEELTIPGAGGHEAARGGGATHEERAAERPTTYKVRRGDTLGKISKRLGVSIAELKRANHLRRNTVRVGETLHVPGAVSEETPPERRETRREEQRAAPPEAMAVSRGEIGKVVEVEAPGRTHRVRRGDTLSKVARELGVSVSELKRINHLRSSHLHAGQVLRGPHTTEKAYVVGPVDTIYSIARRFDVSVERLRAENGLGRSGSIHTGQKLRLPPGYHDRGPAAGQVQQTYTPPPIRTTPQTPAPLPPSRGYVPPTTVPAAPPPAAPTSAPPPSDAQISQMAQGKFVWPLTGAIISDFGPKTEGQRNDGINIQATTGAPVVAAAAGEVVYAGDQVPGFGNLVLIKHSDGWVTAYGHLSRIEVKMQQKVTQGEEIGQAGSTGGVSAPQLHFEVRYAPSPMERARPVDPKLVLPH